MMPCDSCIYILYSGKDHWKIYKEALFALSNVCAGTIDQMRAVMDLEVMEATVDIVMVSSCRLSR